MKVNSLTSSNSDLVAHNLRLQQEVTTFDKKLKSIDFEHELTQNKLQKELADALDKLK